MCVVAKKEWIATLTLAMTIVLERHCEEANGRRGNLAVPLLAIFLDFFKRAWYKNPIMVFYVQKNLLQHFIDLIHCLYSKVERNLLVLKKPSRI
jgi:hypothetical protein